jgi:hypothetical protein
MVKIAIDLPVSGNANEPEFSYGDVVMSALGKLLLKIVLSPFSALADLLGIESNELEEFKFIGGRADLTPPELERVKKLAEALALRPALQLIINGTSDPVVDGLALRTASLDTELEIRIKALEAAGDGELMYAEIKSNALEQLFAENPDNIDPPITLDTIKQPYISLKVVEGQDEPAVKLDRLAYSNELRRLLIANRPVSDNALDTLASKRAENTRAALLKLDSSLQERITIGENSLISKENGGPVKMKVKLSSMSGSSISQNEEK